MTSIRLHNPHVAGEMGEARPKKMAASQGEAAASRLARDLVTEARKVTPVALRAVDAA
jgi:hypothetical protein